MKEQMKELQKLKGIGEVLSRHLVESSYDTIAKCRGEDAIMNGFLRGSLLAALLGIVLALAGCGGGGGSSNPPGASAPTAVVQPLPLPGPYAVACSNVVQDFTRVGAGEDVTSYWEGMPSDNGMPRYATDLLADPGNTLIATVTAPQDSNLYG